MRAKRKSSPSAPFCYLAVRAVVGSGLMLALLTHHNFWGREKMSVEKVPQEIMIWPTPHVVDCMFFSTIKRKILCYPSLLFSRWLVIEEWPL